MKKIVTLGGGTGTFVVLSALKQFDSVSLTAVVSGADDGGSTGRLRDAYGILPVGDARQALVALAENELLRDLFAHRFDRGDIKGHNLGNLLLTALTEKTGSEYNAILAASDILRVKGRVLVATDIPATLVAEYEDGSEIIGESHIDERKESRARITRVFFSPRVEAEPHVLEALNEAEIYILGPGDLYASTIAALCADGIRGSIAASSGRLVYVMNLFTKTGQTEGMRASDFIREIEHYVGRKPNDVFINTEPFSSDVLARYKAEGEFPVEDDLEETATMKIHRVPLASVHSVPPVPEDPVPRSLVRHDPDKLKEAFAILLV